MRYFTDVVSNDRNLGGFGLRDVCCALGTTRWSCTWRDDVINKCSELQLILGSASRQREDAVDIDLLRQSIG